MPYSLSPLSALCLLPSIDCSKNREAHKGHEEENLNGLLCALRVLCGSNKFLITKTTAVINGKSYLRDRIRQVTIAPVKSNMLAAGSGTISASCSTKAKS
jgi:hypothetical protein